ncbi:hypothetical protein P4O66_001310 [Electrophorus voltai]|uniref:Uncharacterized protein n=1 Tax=Electrophorus voltai TaxID=2609070 RepID=A0AAD8ZAD2_9TELE|nr:hypothetical protein P4O66_001310 [Electrophorus voltai]
MDSAGSYEPCMDYSDGWAEYGARGEYRDVGLRSEMEDPSMEVEEVPHGGPSSQSDVTGFVDDEPPAPKAPPKAPPRAHRPEASKLPQVTAREAALSSEDTPLPKARGPEAHAPTSKPHGGKKAATPVPAPEPGNMAGAPPGAHAPNSGQSLLPKPAKDSLPQAGQRPNQPMTGGLAGAPSPFPRLLNMCGGVHLPVPVTVPVSVTLNVPITLFPSASVPISVCVPVSVFVLIPVFPPRSCSRWPVADCPILWRRRLALVSGRQPIKLAHQESRP